MHIGNLIKQRIELDGRTKTDIARACGFTRANLNHILNRPNIDTEQLLMLCKILDYDFFRHYSALIPSAKSELPAPDNSQIHQISQHFEDFVSHAHKIINQEE